MLNALLLADHVPLIVVLLKVIVLFTHTADDPSIVAGNAFTCIDELRLHPVGKV